MDTNAIIDGMFFDCDGCGICCEHVTDHPDIQSLDGVCVLFDQTTRKCIDYENRPSVCNVCETYSDYKHQYTEEEYLKLNYLACDYLKLRYQ